MKIRYLVYFLLFCNTASFAQLSNSQENTYASFYNATSSAINLTTSELSFEFLIPIDTSYFKGTETNEITAKKIKAILPKIGLTGTKSFLKVRDLNFESKNSFLFGLKYINSVNEFIDYSDDEYRPNNIHTLRLELTGHWDKLNVLNPTTQNVSKENPFTLNIDSGIGWYLFPLLHKHIILYPQINAGADLLTYNKKDLESKYIIRRKVNTLESYIITSNEFEGVYGEYEKNVQEYYSNISLPILIDYHWEKIPKFVLTPYSGFMKYSYRSDTEYNLGFSISLLAKNYIQKPDKTDRKVIKKYLNEILQDQDLDSKTKDKIKETINNKIDDTEDNVTRKLKNPTFLTFGIDWIFQNGKNPSHPNIYISGSFSID